MEYAWFNNVETKPGIGYPKEWENQDRWNGGWVRTLTAPSPRQGGKWKLLMRIFANPNLPQIDDYYEPFTFDYDHLQSAPESKAAPTARRAASSPASAWRRSSGARTGKKSWAASSASAARTRTSTMSRRTSTASSKHLHDVPAAPVRALPEPGLRGIVPQRLDLQARGRRHRADRPGQVPRLAHACERLPLQEDLLQLAIGKAEKCIFCYPRIEAASPPCAPETCVGRIRYLGVLLYDADRIQEAASVERDRDLYQAQLDIFLTRTIQT